MSSNIKTVQTFAGDTISYYDEIIGSGTMKDVYFTTDKKHVVAFYRDPLEQNALERLKMITGAYHKGIFEEKNGNYWNNLFCWPTDIVFDGKLHGVVLPKYHQQYFFEHGSINNDFLAIKNREKEGKWFSSPTNRFSRLDKREWGDWKNYLRIGLLVSRAVRRMHAAGLAHSDLSYKNVLISPSSGNACVIDVDGLVVPDKFYPDVVGTPDFIAPEVVATSYLPKDDKNKILPSRLTDRHALAVLIYQYLFLRHPLRGKKIHDMDDPERDESLIMGEKALFVEHPLDNSNTTNPSLAREADQFWLDTRKLPYTVAGPYLSKLFKEAFVDGLHHPQKRPTANDWEQALIKTIDLIQPCSNKECLSQWYVFDNSKKPICPFCDTPYKGQLPVINLYSERGEGRFIPDDHRLMIYKDQSIFPWHVDRNITPNERLDPKDSSRVGYCIFHDNHWLFVNEKLTQLFDATEAEEKKKIAIGDAVELKDGLKLLVKYNSSARLLLVQLV